MFDTRVDGLPPAFARPAAQVAARWVFSPRADWRQSRRRFELATALPAPPRGSAVSTVSFDGVRCEQIVPRGPAGAGVMLYLHGGGYATGSARAYRGLVARIATAAGLRAVVPDYRLAPEHPYPAGLEDAVAVCAAMLRAGTAPERIAVVGDSAGAGLALALALRRRIAGQPLPAVIGLICPWLDLGPTAAARRGSAPNEPVLSEGLLGRFAAAYTGGHDPLDPLISPLYADLRGLPPLVVHTAADDLITADASELCARARAAGVEVVQRSYPGLWHDFHVHAGVVAGAAGAVAELGSVLGARC